ncbi:hypothetical protein TSH7_10025 [Azospirillum sp. TSH7]|uniref:hypothetical protein n=1 Tax=unclassified Azospirillum TaxID=2630922 RepID=UPI000D61CB13|nr:MULTISPECIES: hypothetical protein [unclassified Azospirillum]PWC64005.1 hypothetical protein TSH20_19120 [Azospirillum sp. TSH20]PWC64868.1 hypothetical protein TSH7_10025 [Azospirillum sp. TSH7]
MKVPSYFDHVARECFAALERGDTTTAAKKLGVLRCLNADGVEAGECMEEQRARTRRLDRLWGLTQVKAELASKPFD